MTDTIANINDRAEHWDLTTKIMWDETYVDGLDALLKKRQVDGEPIKHIYDAACGTGFPALQLAARGYHVRCSDGDDAMLAIFRRNLLASREPLFVGFGRKKWSELAPSADFFPQVVMARGNSLVYVSSWDCEDENYALDPEQADEKILEALTKFWDLLPRNGLLYIDLMHRFEKEGNGKMLIGEKKIDGMTTQLFFDVQHIPEQHQRRIFSTLYRLGVDSAERVYNAYLLSHERLMFLLQRAGFRDIEPHVPIHGENHYSVFLARK